MGIKTIYFKVTVLRDFLFYFQPLTSKMTVEKDDTVLETTVNLAAHPCIIYFACIK